MMITSKENREGMQSIISLDGEKCVGEDFIALPL